MSGLKAQAKRYLRAKGIKRVLDEQGNETKLQQAKTSDLLKAAIKEGF